MALRWAGAAMQEAAKGFRRLKAYKQLPLLKRCPRKAQGQSCPFQRGACSNRGGRVDLMSATTASRFSTFRDVQGIRCRGPALPSLSSLTGMRSAIDDEMLPKRLDVDEAGGYWCVELDAPKQRSGGER